MRMHNWVRIASLLLLSLYVVGQASADMRPHENCADEGALRSNVLVTKLEGLLAPTEYDKRIYTPEVLQAHLVETQKELLEKIRSTGLLIVGAVKGHFPEPGCFATFWLGYTGYGLRVVLLDSNHEMRAIGPLGLELHGNPPSAREDTEIKSLESIDLDGDGVDEVLERFSFDHRGYLEEGITIYHLNGRQIDNSLKLITHSNDEGAREHQKEVTHYDAKVSIGMPAADGRRPIIVDGRVRHGRHSRRHPVSIGIIGQAVFWLDHGQIRRVKTGNEDRK